MVNYNCTLILHSYGDKKPQNFGVTILIFWLTWHHWSSDQSLD